MTTINSLVTLASLPPDIIRMIIAIDDGASVRSMRKISGTWRAIVSEYLGSLPPLEWLQLDSTFKGELSIGMKVLPQNVKAFKHSLKTFGQYPRESDDCVVHFSNDPILTEKRCTYRQSLENLHSIIAETTCINHLVLRGFNVRKIRDVRERLRNVKIAKLDVTGDNPKSIQRNLVEMASLHSIEEMEIYTDVGRGQDLYDFLLDLARFVSVIRVVATCAHHQTCSMSSLFGLSNEAWTWLTRQIVKNPRFTSISLQCSCWRVKKVYISQHLAFVRMFDKLEL